MYICIYIIHITQQISHGSVAMFTNFFIAEWFMCPSFIYEDIMPSSSWTSNSFTVKCSLVALIIITIFPYKQQNSQDLGLNWIVSFKFLFLPETLYCHSTKMYLLASSIYHLSEFISLLLVCLVFNKTLTSLGITLYPEYYHCKVLFEYTNKYTCRSYF